MDEKLKKLISDYPNFSTELIDIYENIKHIPDACKFLDFAIRTNMDLKKAEEFFIKTYGS